ncbi:alpha/beta hydrolase [Naumannella sp. ID2617S]|nr:alpha/beta hydrolase [Naumannella sp. ID2617S]
MESVLHTSAGPVEATVLPGELSPVLFFGGGHCTAQTPCGQQLYAELGHTVVTVSRPGYGRTGVGPLTAAEFAPLLGEVCDLLELAAIAACVGVSSGGMQAVHAALAMGDRVRSLVLHSAAPSALPFPDVPAQRAAARLMFAPGTEDATWAGVRRLVRSDSGLRRMLGTLSRLPAVRWWPDLTATDLAAARETFYGMDSGSGFLLDVRQGTAALATFRTAALARVGVPTLVTGSRHDAGVSWSHAESQARLIPGAELVDTEAPTHFFWIGPTRGRVTAAIERFLA